MSGGKSAALEACGATLCLLAFESVTGGKEVADAEANAKPRRGQTVHYRQVTFQRGNQLRSTGTIPATISDFKIDPPSLRAVAVKNEIPVRVDMTWRPK
jgi:hypothetical protein